MMNKKEIFRKVGGILNELNDQYEYLSKSPENLNDLELELFAANANFLSDHISILVKLNGTTPQVSASSGDSSALNPDSSKPSLEPESFSQNSPEPDPEESVQSDEFDVDERPENSEPETYQADDREPSSVKFDFGSSESAADSEPEDKSEDVSPAPETEEGVELKEDSEEDFPEEKDTYTEQPAPEPELQVNKTEPETEPEPYIKEVVISERTVAIPTAQTNSDPKPTLNDLLSSKSATTESFGSQFSHRQVKDLKSMVSLNDKLLFVRDLFNGYSLAYSEAIELLNRFDNFESAQNFLKANYSGKNNWAEKQEVADKFYEILERRYSK